MISQADLNAFRDAINQFNSDIDKTTVVLKSKSKRLDHFGEEVSPTVDITLNCTLAYNYFRTWPINVPTPSGIVDKENLVAEFNFDYLDSLGLIHNGSLNIDAGTDYFIVEGLEYGVYGHTNVSQAGEKPLSVYVILQRLPK